MKLGLTNAFTKKPTLTHEYGSKFKEGFVEREKKQ